MKLVQRKLFRFWQQLRGIHQQVVLNNKQLRVDFNQQIHDVCFDKINAIKLHKGWWFSALYIELNNNSELVLDGYLYSSLSAFRAKAISHILNDYYQSKPWPVYLTALKLLESQQHYFSSYEWQPLVELQSLAVQFSGLKISANDIDHPQAKQVFVLANQLGLADISQTARAHHNQIAADNLLANNKTFFDTVEKQKLTPCQRRACVTNEDHNLVIAGAGTGKTATLVGKAGFLTQYNLAQPHQILMLAFGQKAALEMNQRIQAKLPHQANQLKASTFHALGFEIVCRAWQAKNKPEIKLSKLSSNPKLLSDFISDVLAQGIKQSVHYQTKLNQYCHHQFSSGTTVENIQPTHWQWRALVSLMSRFLTLYKEGGYELDNIKHSLLINSAKLTDENAFNLIFLSLFKPVLQAYQRHLQQHNELDFADMISLAIQAIESGEYQTEFQYILVDEFQDISTGRVKLLTALLKAQPNARLFAVGDDWQAIYRFNGADLSLFTQFESNFSPAVQVSLDKTFRFHNQTHQLSSQFVSENPAQIPKQMTTASQFNRQAIHLMDINRSIQANSVEQAYQLQLTECLTALNSQAKAQSIKQSVLLIGRFSQAKMPMLKSFNIPQQAFSGLDVQYVTAHASKGLEADHVIIVGVDDGIFPSTRQTEAVLNLVLPEAESYLHAEERRLFYVALTRAKQQLFILYNSAQPSCFIDELSAFCE